MPPASGEAEGAAVAALERGDVSGALAILCRELGGPIYRYCRRMVADGALAADVHQNVFAQACEDLPSLANRGSLRSWLCAIAHHRCLDALKSHRRFARRISLQDELPEHADPAPEADERLASRALAASLGECLEALELHVRMAVLLRYQEGLGYEEIARISRERAGTLQARVVRAMPLLRKCLEGKGVEP